MVKKADKRKQEQDLAGEANRIVAKLRGYDSIRGFSPSSGFQICPLIFLG